MFQLHVGLGCGGVCAARGTQCEACRCGKTSGRGPTHRAYRTKVVHIGNMPKLGLPAADTCNEAQAQSPAAKVLVDEACVDDVKDAVEE